MGRGSREEAPAGWSVSRGGGSGDLEAWLAALVEGRENGMVCSTIRGEEASAIGGGVDGGGTDGGSMRSARLLLLHPHGEPIRQVLAGGTSSSSLCGAGDDEARTRSQDQGQTRGTEAQGQGTVLVLGDHLGLTADELATLQWLGAERASVGPVPVLASHSIVLAQAALDCAALEEGQG